jgi:hypothetical protein
MGLENFSAALDLLIGFDIDLYVADEVVKGKLMGVESDHIILEDEKKYIFYYSIDKVHAITKNTREFMGEEPKGNFQKTKSLTELLHSFKNSWVSILSLNKKRFSGVLSDIDADFATLINGEERILIKLSHVSNILKGFIVEEEAKLDKKETKAKDEKKDNDSKDNTDKNKSEGKSEDKSDHKSDDNSEDKSEKKSKSSSKDATEKKSKHSSEQKQVQTTFDLDNESKLGWSEPIKPVVASCKTEKEQVKEEKAVAPIMSNEFKKEVIVKNQVEKKTEKPKSSENNHVASQKVKEETMKVEKINTMPMTKKEVKPTKSAESVQGNKQVKSVKPTEAAAPIKQESSTAKTATSHKNETEQQNNKNNVWKPITQEEKAFRFSGEPVSKEENREFPFAGWPNRKSRSSRNLFF